MEQKIKSILSSVLNIPVNELNDNASSNNIEKWDSLHHMNVIFALEEEFGVQFSDDDIVQMSDYKTIVQKVKEKTGK